MSLASSAHASADDLTGLAILRPYDRREAMSTKEAAAVAGKGEDSIRRWCATRRIGRRVAGGEWQVSRVLLAMLLDGDEPAMQAYWRGDRSGPLVRAYFQRYGL